MTPVQVSLYALRFRRLRYSDVLPTTVVTIGILVSDARSSAQRFERGLQTSEVLTIDERLATRSCLKSLEHVLEVWPDRQGFDMREFEEGIGPFPQLTEIKTALDWISRH